MMKLKLRNCLLLCLLGGVALTPAYPQQTAVTPSQPQAVSGDKAVDDNSADDTDIDLASPPLPAAYAHGARIAPLWHNRIPAPRNPQALKRYLQAQELDNIGFAYLAYRRYDKAVARLNQSLALWPDNAQTYRWLAEAYEAKGDTQQAIADYRLLFYGWPGRVRSGQSELPDDKVPADKARDYDQATPAETDPTLLMRFSLLLQQTNQFAEAKRAYGRGMQVLADKFPDAAQPLPPLSAEGLAPPSDLEAAARTALAVDQVSYGDTRDAQDNLNQALRLRPGLAVAQSELSKIRTGG